MFFVYVHQNLLDNIQLPFEGRVHLKSLSFGFALQLILSLEDFTIEYLLIYLLGFIFNIEDLLLEALLFSFINFHLQVAFVISIIDPDKADYLLLELLANVV